VLGWVLVWMGLAVMWFAVYTLWGTRAISDAAQKQPEAEFEQQVSAAGAPRQLTPEEQQRLLTELGAVVDNAAPTAGIARIRIPKLGVDAIVVNGTDREALQHGPGLFQVPERAAKQLPGAPGNTTISGHRTTFGAWFNRIDELVPGDQILVDTLAGTTTYEVTGQQVVAPTDVYVAMQFGDNRVTLTACNPKFSARERIIVTGRMVDGPFFNMAPPPSEQAAPAPQELPGGNP